MCAIFFFLEQTNTLSSIDSYAKPNDSGKKKKKNKQTNKQDMREVWGYING